MLRMMYCGAAGGGGLTWRGGALLVETRGTRDNGCLLKASKHELPVPGISAVPFPGAQRTLGAK
jgi:hypothetical protein